MTDYLRKVVFEYPAIDNHAHPLLIDDSTHDFNGVISEARGPALAQATSGLPALRAARQLGPLYGVEEDAPSWETIAQARKGAEDMEEIKQTCFEAAKIQCLLLDDGLGTPGQCESIPAHDRFTRSPSKRIVRVECVAEELLCKLFDAALSGNSSTPFSIPHLLQSFTSGLGPELTKLARSPDIVGFKSIVCYRTGLAVVPEHDIRRLEVSLGMISNRYWAALSEGKREIRLQDKPVNDFVVRTAMTVGAAMGKPVQFHTGLGDYDLLLAQSTPALLQPLLRVFSDTPVVLLHAAYPFTREAGYLAAMFEHVYLDFGEVWPFIAAHGQRRVVSEVLELCPAEKALWSTDGHYWAETFYLGARQGRQALFEVLAETIARDELSEVQAAHVAKSVLFDNANRLYRLELEPAWEE